MRGSSTISKVRKYDYINATESVLKLLRIVKDNSPKRFSEVRQRVGHETLDFRDLQSNTKDTIGIRRRDKKKNSLKIHDFDNRRLFPMRPRRHCLDTSETESTELMFPVIEIRKNQRSHTQPPVLEEVVCASMPLSKKDQTEVKTDGKADIKLQTLRSRHNLHSLCAFEDSLSQPRPSVIANCKRRVITDMPIRYIKSSVNKEQIAKLEKVLVEDVNKSNQRENQRESPTRKLIESYEGWDFQKTNSNWEFSIMQAMRCKK